jgi:hypothetical protein
MLLAAFLLIGTFQSARLDEPTRPELVSSSRQFFVGADADGDGALSLVEWTGIARPRPGEESSTLFSELRAYLIGAHVRMDGDRDGKVSFDELVREPLASFDCMDGDRDLRLSRAEIESGRRHCPFGPAIRIGIISEPPPDDAPAR